MCGIIGWVGEEIIDENKFLSGLQTLKRRGPDLQAYTRTDGALLGHSRLSILDLSPAGNQPMRSGSLIMVYNGEIFNYKEIAGEIIKIRPDVRFTSTGDAEVLLKAYETWGEECVEKLNGFFAFAVYDEQKKTLFAARDYFGIKPFWYVNDERGIFFASEAKAIFAAGYRFELNPVSVYHYFQLNYVPPDTSIWHGVDKLPPGTKLHWKKSKLEVKKYIPKTSSPKLAFANPQKYEEHVENVKLLVDEAVRIRLVSDVPLGVFLSGGIDSSLVATVASQYVNQLQTFSIGFDDPLFDETQYAELVANRIKSSHNTFVLSFDELSESVWGLLEYLDEPFADSSAINTYILSQRVGKYVKVALSGDGADELFGGYMKHVGEAKAREKSMLNYILRLISPILVKLPSSRNSSLGRKIWQIQKYAEGLHLSFAERYWRWASVQDDDFLQNLLKIIPTPELLTKTRMQYLEGISRNGDMNDVLNADMYLVLSGDMLTKVDMTSMAHSLEVRPPFLDSNLTNYVRNLKPGYKILGKERKKILRDAFKESLPKELYYRPKQGFEVPLRKLFVGPLKTYIESEIVNRKRIESNGLFRYPPIELLWKRIQLGENTKDDWTLWALIVFTQCLKKYGNYA
jgi:asparagine synthase (glutamine-hydrolysing)